MRYLHEVLARNTELGGVFRLHVSYPVQHSVPFCIGLDRKGLGAKSILIPEA
jgi:hypothetical protein